MYCVVRAESLKRIQSILDFKGLQNIQNVIVDIFVFTM
jgi:hypothetical protein